MLIPMVAKKLFLTMLDWASFPVLPGKDRGKGD
jgi:hypothetical protein